MPVCHAYRCLSCHFVLSPSVQIVKWAHMPCILSVFSQPGQDQKLHLSLTTILEKFMAVEHYCCDRSGSLPTSSWVLILNLSYSSRSTLSMKPTDVTTRSQNIRGKGCDFLMFRQFYCFILFLQSNLKIAATKLQHEIEELQRRTENVKMKLTSEMKVIKDYNFRS